MEGEDLVSPFEEGDDERLELGQGPAVVALDELVERLVGFLVVSGEVDAVQQLVELPGVGEFGWPNRDLLELRRALGTIDRVVADYTEKRARPPAA